MLNHVVSCSLFVCGENNDTETNTHFLDIQSLDCPFDMIYLCLRRIYIGYELTNKW